MRKESRCGKWNQEPTLSKLKSAKSVVIRIKSNAYNGFRIQKTTYELTGKPPYLKSIKEIEQTEKNNS